MRAHDPGLSSLEVGVGGDGISVLLSLAGADVALAAPGRETDTQLLGELARSTVRLSLDGRMLPSVGDEVSFEDGGARIRLSFDIPASSHPSRQLTITSDVPKRVSRAHRELLIVRVGGRVAAEALLDVARDSASVDLGAPPPKARIAWIFLAEGVGHILSGYDHLVFLAGLLLAACAGPASARASARQAVSWPSRSPRLPPPIPCRWRSW